MRLRSLLFVPGDRPDRFDKAAAAGADALILDLEDAVTVDRKPIARDAVANRLAASGGGPLLVVRVNPVNGPFFEADLDMLARAMPAAIMLPKAEGAQTVAALDAHLQRRGLETRPLLPIATETPAAMFGLGSYAAVAERLIGLTWGAEDLSAAIGAASAREPDGRYTPPYEMARSLTLFAAAAAGTAPIDTIYPALHDLPGLERYATRAARDGFTGMMAIHPAQVAAINRAFTPDEAALHRARAIIAAFAAAPGYGAVQYDGMMLDAPHLSQARALLARAGETA